MAEDATCANFAQVADNGKTCLCKNSLESNISLYYNIPRSCISYKHTIKII
jgi:hypothetical protein